MQNKNEWISPIDMVAEARKRTSQAIVLMANRPEAYVNNEWKPLDPDTSTVVPSEEEGMLFAPVAFLAESIGARTVLDPTNQRVTAVLGNRTWETPIRTVNNISCAPVREFMEKSGKSVFSDPSGLMIVSDPSNRFDAAADSDVIAEIGNMFPKPSVEDAGNSAGGGSLPAKVELADAREWKERGGLPNFFAALNSKQPVTIAYLGGSITAHEGWRVQTFNQFKAWYPDVKLTMVNAGQGGTGSDLGAFRVEHDVISRKPTLVFVEFAVNDGSKGTQAINWMEGIVRQIWRANPKTDIVFVYTMQEPDVQDLLRGKYPQMASIEDFVADHYGIPSIHMGYEVANRIQAGKVVFKGEGTTQDGKLVFTNDGTHPVIPSGHQLYADAVIRSFEHLRDDIKAASVAHRLIAPISKDNWEDVKTVSIGSIAHYDGNWQKTGGAGKYESLLTISKPGGKASFTFTGTKLGFEDRIGPWSGQMIVTIDGIPHTYNRFSVYNISERDAYFFVQDLPNTEHTVTIELSPEMPDKAAILKSYYNPKNYQDYVQSPSKYEGTALKLGNVMIKGQFK